MSDVRAGLMQAILAEPREDTVRLVFADWLEEHGNQSERRLAEFIRAQVELARWGAYPRRHGHGVLVRHGEGYYDCTSMTDNYGRKYAVGDRVDYQSLIYGPNKDSILRRGLLVTQVDDVKGRTILKRDPYSKKYPVALREREQHILHDGLPWITDGVGGRYFFSPEGTGFWLGQHCFHAVWRRGFVDEIRCGGGSWLTDATTILTYHPDIPSGSARPSGVTTSSSPKRTRRCYRLRTVPGQRCHLPLPRC